MSKQIIGKHPNGHAYGISLTACDKATTSGVLHRKLSENGNRDIFMNFTAKALKTHHISPSALERRKEKINLFRIRGLDISRLSPYPTNNKTQSGNFAEVVIAEYLSAATSASLPVYRLRYNPNVDQSMKGDDVLLFDLDSDPVRIIVSESKFRGIPSKDAVIEITDGLIRSNKGSLPTSLMFVTDRLYDEGNIEHGEKVSKCVDLIVDDKLDIDYVGFLLSNHNVAGHVDRNTTTDLHNLLMISLGVNSPETMVQDAFRRLGSDL